MLPLYFRTKQTSKNLMKTLCSLECRYHSPSNAVSHIVLQRTSVLNYCCKILNPRRSNYVFVFYMCRLLMVGEEDHASFGRE